MRTPSRLVAASVVLGGALLIAGPAAAQEVDCDDYPADCPIVGGIDSPAQGSEGEGAEGGGTAGGAASAAEGSSLPFTGGEVTLVALAGIGAVGAGTALTMAARKRTTA